MKKRIWIPILVVILTLAAVLIYKNTYLTFSDFLDKNDMVYGISKSTLKELQDNYSYEGLALSEWMPDEMFWDDDFGGGSSVTGKYFGFENEFVAKDGVAKHINKMYTKVPLGGLRLPYCLSFNDPLEKVLKRLGFSVDPYDGFVSDSDMPGIMTLSADDGITYRLIDGRIEASSDIFVKEEYTYVIQYTEVSEETRSDGTVAEVTRFVNLYFLAESNALGRVELGIKEVYPFEWNRD